MKKVFVADFETSTESWLARDNGWARVWLWDVCDVETLNHTTGTSIHEFMRYVAKKTLGEGKKIYFHNLRYDGAYILSWLEEFGFKWKQDGRELRKKEYSTLISGEGQFYSIKVCFGEHGKTKNLVEFWDSLKKFPQSVATLAKTFNLPILKGEIDYDMYRPRAEWSTSKTQYELGADYCFGKNIKLNLEYAFVNDRSLKKHSYNMVDVQVDVRF